MFQRKPNTSKAALDAPEMVRLSDLIRFIDACCMDLSAEGDDMAALRFEILGDYLRNDFRGGRLTYNPKFLGL